MLALKFESFHHFQGQTSREKWKLRKDRIKNDSEDAQSRFKRWSTFDKNGICFCFLTKKRRITESGLEGLDEPHDECGAFRDVLKHFSHFVVATAYQTGLVDTLDVVTDLKNIPKFAYESHLQNLTKIWLLLFAVFDSQLRQYQHTKFGYNLSHRHPQLSLIEHCCMYRQWLKALVGRKRE